MRGWHCRTNATYNNNIALHHANAIRASHRRAGHHRRSGRSIRTSAQASAPAIASASTKNRIQFRFNTPHIQSVRSSPLLQHRPVCHVSSTAPLPALLFGRRRTNRSLRHCRPGPHRTRHSLITAAPADRSIARPPIPPFRRHCRSSAASTAAAHCYCLRRAASPPTGRCRHWRQPAYRIAAGTSQAAFSLASARRRSTAPATILLLPRYTISAHSRRLFHQAAGTGSQVTTATRDIASPIATEYSWAPRLNSLQSSFNSPQPGNTINKV